jgi:L-cystine uptake protein TcyP (sodium:dicarboxylate symporter family)
MSVYLCLFMFIIHMIIRAPSRVSPQTFVNFVYLYVNKEFTTQTMLKVTPQRGAKC